MFLSWLINFKEPETVQWLYFKGHVITSFFALHFEHILIIAVVIGSEFLFFLFKYLK